MMPHLRKPDPTRTPAMLSRATPVLTMFGSWTTPNKTTVNNSPEGHTHTHTPINKSHDVILISRREMFHQVTYNMWHQDYSCERQETQCLRVHSHRPGDRNQGRGQGCVWLRETTKTCTGACFQPTSKGRRWRCRRWGCWRAGCGRCRPRTFAICCKGRPDSPGHWWLAAQELWTGQKVTLICRKGKLSHIFQHFLPRNLDRSMILMLQADNNLIKISL